jgi:hypothetical protein
LTLKNSLPVSTATKKQALPAMKLDKTCLCTKLGDDFLCHYVIVYIEKETTEKFSIEENFETFDLCACKAELKLIDM